MKRWHVDELVLLALALVVFVGSVCAGIRVATVEAHCLALGWTKGVIAWNFAGYCVARTDQTDVVVPWREAKRR